MNDAAALLDLEAIKQLKARYCRLLDAKDWTAWRDLFCDDLISDIVGAGGGFSTGADDFVAYTRRSIGKRSQSTVHQVHSPEIVLESETTARGVWALNDVVLLVPSVTLQGYGHYHETYEKAEGQWRIRSLRLDRLREDIISPLVAIMGTRRVRAAALAIARRTSDMTSI